MTKDERRSMLNFQNAALIFMAILITSVVFVVDLKTNSTIAAACMYAVVILYSWLLPGRFTSFYAASICTVLTIIGALERNTLSAGSGNLSGMNVVISLVVIWTCVTLVFIAKSSFTRLEAINKRLSYSSAALLEKVKKLDEKQEELTASKLQLEKLNSDLVTKNRELERFTSIASHDLQEPLRTIGNMTHLIAKKYSSNFDDQGKKILDYVTTATSRMTNLIKGLLDFSRIGTKREIHPVDCQALVENIVLDLDSSLKSVNGTIKYEGLPTVNGNSTELRMLFQNLISNGLKFSKNETAPVIELGAKEHPMFVEFWVKDNGIGIDESDYEKIFLIFQRLNPTEAYDGTGLGLAYCRKIVELHGGKIWIDSTKDMGSVFYFTLSKRK
jgi:signal transduction histidine kinase